MRYIKELDSLRTIAVLFVIVAHWIPDERFSLFGRIGVDTFFVLSGFLISGILLNNITQAKEKATKKVVIFKNFYARRALRIFPVFYVLILITYLSRTTLAIGLDTKSLFFGAIYSLNFYLFKIQQWPDYVTHLWSLAVEEQFYLLWPFVLINTSKRIQPFVIVGFVLLGITSFLFLKGNEFGYLLTFTCLDAFGLGALLAWLYNYHKSYVTKVNRWLGALAFISLVILLVAFFIDRLYAIPLRTINSLMALWMISYLVSNKDQHNSLFLRFFRNRKMIFVGKISYGVYLFHMLIPSIPLYFFHKLTGLYLPDENQPVLFGLVLLMDLGLLLAVAAFSWKFFERPLLQYKRHFELKQEVDLLDQQS